MARLLEHVACAKLRMCVLERLVWAIFRSTSVTSEGSTHRSCFLRGAYIKTSNRAMHAAQSAVTSCLVGGWGVGALRLLMKACKILAPLVLQFKVCVKMQVASTCKTNGHSCPAQTNRLHDCWETMVCDICTPLVISQNAILIIASKYPSLITRRLLLNATFRAASCAKVFPHQGPALQIICMNALTRLY